MRNLIVQVPIGLWSKYNFLKPAAWYVADFLVDVLNTFEFVGQVLVSAEFDYFVVPRLTFVDETFDATFTSSLGLRPKAALLKRTEHNNSFQVIFQILKHDTTNSLNYPVAHQSAANLKIRSIEANYSTVCEFKSTGSAQARNKIIAAHFANEFIVAIHSEAIIGPFKQVMRNWRVVRGMFTVVPNTWREWTLICFT